MKRAFIGAGAEGHPRNGGVAIIGQQLELIGDGEVEVLALVLQHAAQELPGRRVRLERRVQRAAAELTGARPGPRLHNNPAAEKPPAAEIAITGRERAGAPGFGRRQERQRFGGTVEGEAMVHQLCTAKSEQKICLKSA